MSKEKKEDNNSDRDVNIGPYCYRITIMRGHDLALFKKKYSDLIGTDPDTGERICRLADYICGNDGAEIKIPTSIKVDGHSYYTRCPRAYDFSDYDNAMYGAHQFTSEECEALKKTAHKYEDTIRITNTTEVEKITLCPSIIDNCHKFDIDDIQWGELRKLKAIDYIAPGNVEPTKSWRVIHLYGMKFLIEQIGHTAQMLHDDYHGVVIIPGKIIYKGEEYTVTSLNEHCFSGSHVTHVAIPSTIHRLPDFYKSHELFTVSIPPSSITCLPEMIFEYSKLKRITIPRSVQQIQDRCFNHCEELEEVDMPDTINYIGDVCFTGCKKLKSITIPMRVTYLGNICLWYCDGLEEIHCMVNVPPVPKPPVHGVMAWSEDFDKDKDDYMTFFKFHDDQAFDRIKLYVPRLSVEAYKANKYWPFKNIIGI